MATSTTDGPAAGRLAAGRHCGCPRWLSQVAGRGDHGPVVARIPDGSQVITQSLRLGEEPGAVRLGPVDLD